MRISTGVMALLAVTTATPALAQARLNLPALLGSKLDPRSVQRADVVQLVPSTADGRAVRFELDSDGSIAPDNAALQLVHVPAASNYAVQIPFKVAVPGLERIAFDCALIEYSLAVAPSTSGPARLIGRGWYAAQVSGPAAGVIQLGLARDRSPAEEQADVAEAARALARRVTGTGQPASGAATSAPPAPLVIALCEMTASGQWQGTSWRSVTDPLQGLGTRERSQSVQLFDTGRGLRWASQPFVTTPAVIVGAVPPGLQD